MRSPLPPTPHRVARPRAAPSRFAGLALAAITLTPLIGGGAGAARRAPEYDLKATFLFHFTHFVEWPAEAFADASAPLRLCVLEPDPFGTVLGEIVAGEHAAGRELEARTVERASDATGCQIVFVPRDRDSAVVRDLPGQEDGLVLTVGERDDFLDRGGMVRFELVESRIRLVVSRKAISKSRLSISSKLLALAHLE